MAPISCSVVPEGVWHVACSHMGVVLLPVRASQVRSAMMSLPPLLVHPRMSYRFPSEACLLTFAR